MATAKKRNHDKKLGSMLFYTDYESKDSSGPSVTIRHDELLQEFAKAITDEYNIEGIWVYKVPLSSCQPTMMMFLFYHAYIVFKTKSGWFYSIETSDSNISMKRSKDETQLLRSDTECMMKPCGKDTIFDIFAYLQVMATVLKRKHDENLVSMLFDGDFERNNPSIRHDELLQGFAKAITDEYDIEKIWVYKVPLSSCQPTMMMFMFYHAYIVFKTKSGWFYSIETSDSNITMKRSKDKLQLDQKNSKCMIEAGGKDTIFDVFAYLQERDRLNLRYNVLVENCKDLAKWLFDRFNSEGKTLHLCFTSY